ncbi:hypothetical protein NMQ15_07765 [Staphylococcus haemolyticus]|uniref:hypothetical protein n=1 Tax=Staphylococcus TaxID=1279 RepID=UPI0022483EF3|nr:MULTISPECIES: hypothetical protein [Staphylococcus]MCW9138042.1 hypothetical protein [Staphylococcus haemolyticus]MCW9140685.1 hypothetical protein [Staphylococcus sp. SUC_1.2]
MSQYEVEFNLNDFGQNNNDIQYLKTAIDKLTSESEKQFQTIKNEKWYTRIIDLATLSNKKNIRISQQISSLAQAQDVLIELLKRLSATDVEIDNMLLNNMHKVENLYSHTEKLALKVKELKEQMLFGINQSKSINDLKEVDKKILYTLLQEASKTFENTSENQKYFADSLFRYLNIEYSTINLVESVNQLDSVTTKKVLLQLLLEYGFLNDNNFEFNSKFEEIVELFDFGNKTIKEIKNTVNNIYKLRGIEGFSWFNSVTIDDDFILDLDIEDDLSQESESLEEKTLFELEQIMVVNQDEEKIIKNKVINLSSIITVKGRLQFKNCDINIKDDFVPMTLKSGILDFENCRIYAISEQDSSIIKSDDDSEINISHSLIRTTRPLYEGEDGKTIIKDSHVDIQNQNFLKCKDIEIKNCILKRKILIDTNKDNSYTSSSFFETNEGTIKIKNSTFENLKKLFSYWPRPKYIEIEDSIFDDFCELGDLKCSYNADNNGIIKNTIINQVDEELNISNFDIIDIEIKNSESKNIDISSSKVNNLKLNKVKNVTFNTCTIENSELNKMKNVSFSFCTIENLKAINVDAIDINHKNKFLKTSFNNCYFETFYRDGNEFYNSVFSNATIEPDGFKKGYLDFLFNKKDFRDTKIERCLFKNINVKGGYVINLGCYEKVKYKLFELKNCIFENCESEHSSLISLKDTYWPRFSRNSKTVILGSESDNIGLENLQNK